MESSRARSEPLRKALDAHARTLGFSLLGVCDPSASAHMDFYRSWVAAGRHGEMGYLAREDALARRADLTRTMDDVRSVVVVGHEYFREDPPGVPDDPSRGVIARYARGRDYHRVMASKLRDLLALLDARVEGGVRGRAYVDTGPVLERELASRAGLGWFGKNTMLIHPATGSYFFLGLLLVDVPLPLDEPFEDDRCGKCRACLEACPTGALLGRNRDGAPIMDARRCISYLTIEQRGPIPVELRSAMGNRIYGCDICQEVCPFNMRFAEAATEPAYAERGPGEPPTGVQPAPRLQALPGKERASPAPHPGTDAPSLVELMRMTRSDWDAFSRGSAIRRAGYAGFRRNVAVAMGNWLAGVDDPPPDAIAALKEALKDESDLVREHVGWALERLRR